MATLSSLRTLTFVFAFVATNAVSTEDALAVQRLHENAAPELQEVVQRLLQEPDLDEDAEQVVGHAFRQLGNEQDLDEDEEVEEKEETDEQEANGEEEDLFGNLWESLVSARVQLQDFRPEEEQDVPTDKIKDLVEMPPDTDEVIVTLPHIGEVGPKNTEAYDGEPIMIRDAEDDNAKIFSQRNLLQMNQFSFNGNVLNRPKNKEEDVAHWIVQFCPRWWDPCVGLTESFAKVGSELEEQLNGALFMKNIRFAIVDCASDKVLCNEQEVATYPTTRHYYKGEFVAGWFGGQAHHEKFYTEWLMQQAQGITAETPAGYLVGNLTNSTKSSKEEETAEIALPTFEEIATDLLVVAVLVALCIRAVLSDVRMWQGATQQQQQQQLQQHQQQSQQQLQQQSESPCQQESPKKTPLIEHCRQGATSQMPSIELYLPSSWKNPANSMEL